ncbi:winged helix-turn-helix transcriptional regulator [Nonomuraea recticatena]|uniref:winged helix-turn-helix transcriptional regulator n=1 Tax=Nonomuraea recticatena TaxID=46178 RepID=UPI00361EA31B
MEDGTIKSLGYCGDTDGDYDVLQWDTRADCEVRQILDRVADKWSLLVIALLDRRSLRFTELRRLIDGVSQRMLTRTLRHLERDGLVSRTVHATVPPRVDYELTRWARPCTPPSGRWSPGRRRIRTRSPPPAPPTTPAYWPSSRPPRRRRPSGPRSPTTSWRPPADASPRRLYAVRGKARR